jgi:hypothetical protein
MTEIVKFPEKSNSANAAAEEQSRSHLFAATIARLAAASTQDYERMRAKEAKALGCRPGVLDRLVKNVRSVIDDARRNYSYKEDVPIAPGSRISVDGSPVFAAVEMRFHGAAYWSGHRFEGGRLYSFCVAPDGEASVVIGWRKDTSR